MSPFCFVLLLFTYKASCDEFPRPENVTSPNEFYNIDYEDSRSAVNNEIGGSFSNKHTFACPLVKSAFHTGESLANLNPEDISIVAAMGDSLASGRGLWEGTDVEFRGAAFPIGGDANMDGLVTFPNILSQFTDNLDGLSHGMGPRDRMPDYQFNVAQAGAETEDLPLQALELIRRLRKHEQKQLKQKWVLLTIAIGSEELCYHCEPPSHVNIRRALGSLRKAIPKLFVVLLGPVHVASSYQQSINLMKPRCPCLRERNTEEYRSVLKQWKESFMKVEEEFNRFNYTSFGVLALPKLAIHSRDPNSLFVKDRALLNRKGHTYAAKWYWNMLIGGPGFNSSLVALSQDSYYCPSIGCPYFRTVQNFDGCKIRTMDEWLRSITTTMNPKEAKKHSRTEMRNNLFSYVFFIVFLALCSVCAFGSIFYCHGMRATKGRFDYSQKEGDEKDEEQEN